MWTRPDGCGGIEDARHEGHAPASWNENEREARRERARAFSDAIAAEAKGLIDDITDIGLSCDEWWRDPAEWERLQNHVMERLCDIGKIRIQYAAGYEHPGGPP